MQTPSLPPTGPPAEPAPTPASSPTRVLPVIAEYLVVHREEVETGRVRVTKHVTERLETVTSQLRHDETLVERVPRGEVVTEAPLPRQEGDVLIIPVLREEVVMTTRLVLVEEVRITRRQLTALDTQTVRLRQEAIQVTREPAGEGLAESGDEPQE